MPPHDTLADDVVRQQLDAIVSGADVAIITQSLDGLITRWNAGAQQLFGYPPEDIVGHPLRVLSPPDRAAEDAETLQRVARGEEVRLFNTERLRNDGGVRNVSISATPIRDSNGGVAGVSLIVRDNTTRLRMETALRDSEQRFRSTLDSIMEGCQLLGYDWRFLYLNDAVALQNRRPNKELIGRTMQECWPGIEHTDVFAMLRRSMEERIALQSEVEFRFPDGSVGHFETRAQPVPEGLFILSIDISDRRAQEQELKRLNRLHDARSHVNRAIVLQPAREELFSDVCRIVVEQGGIDMAWMGWQEPGATRVLPVASWGDHRGYLRQIEIRLDDHPEGRGPTARALREQRPYVCNDVLADAATVPWHADYARSGFRAAAAFPVLVDGEAHGVLSVYSAEPGFFQQREVELLQEAVADVGFALQMAAREQEKESAHQHALSERQFSEAMIESMPGVAYFYDEAGHFLRWNQSFLAASGYPPEAMSTLHPRDFFLGDDRRRVEEAIARTFETGQGSVQGGFVARDGTVTPYFFTGRRIDMGDRRYLVGVGVDISVQEAAEAEVRRLNTELEARIKERTQQLEIANRELESFSYSVSHDLRAPLRAVNGFCDILVEDFAPQLPDEAQEYLVRIRDAGCRMGDLIDDLLDFSRLARKPITRTPVDMSALARRAMLELEPQCKDRRVDVRIGELPACEGDGSLLRQVWINLLSNAVKYTRGREVAVVEIGSMFHDGLCIYSVRDNGTGFDMRYAGKLFGVFQRMHRSDEFEGTGVGLAIVRRILQRHGGRIWVEAMVDRGATFFFTVGGEAAQ